MENRKKIIKVALMIFSIVLFIGVVSLFETTNASEKTTSLYPIEAYNPLYLTDNKLNDQKVLESAEALLNGKLVVNNELLDKANYDINRIDWDVSATLSPNTFSLYLHSLRPVYYLTKAYIETDNKDYLDAAEKIIYSWIDYDGNTEKKNRYTWYDHTVAERTENLIYFAIAKKSVGNDENLDHIIKKHAEWLNEDANYVKNHNHGIFEDGALIKAGYYLNNNDYVLSAIERLDKQLQYAFPNKYIHIENSIGYHMGIISYMKNLNEFLMYKSDGYSDTLTSYIDGSLDYLVYAYNPDLSTPLLGDTLGNESDRSSVSDNYDNQELLYVQTKGAEGVQPEQLTRVYKQDGYTIFREHWDKDNYEQATWLMFKSGYASSTHKHADDLSFILYSKGHDIFIDPGMYNYMVGNPIHDYINSTSAHNTIVVDDNSYSISMFNSKKVGLYEYKKHTDYQSVTGFNNIYDGVSIDRTINYINGNHFLIVDDIRSNEEHKYSQLFHLSNDIEVLEVGSDLAVLRIIGTNYYVLMQQLNGADYIQKYSGNSTSGKLSYVSTGLNNVRETTTLEFIKHDDNTQFVTSVQIVTEGEIESKLNETPYYNGDEVVIDDFNINVVSRDRLPEMDVDVDLNNTEATITNRATSSEKLTYAFYLLDKDNGKKVTSTSYSYENSTKFDLDKGQSYALIGYMRNKSYETSKKLIGYIESNKDGFTFTRLSQHEQEPYAGKKSYSKIGNKTYKFDVQMSNMNMINTAWYIYKDGASFDYVANQSDELEYTFDEPGNYTVIYRVKDIYFGEVEYNHFEEILVE